MTEDEAPPQESADLEWLEEHVAILRREISNRNDDELRKAAHMAILAGDNALDENELHSAVLQYLAAAFLIEAAKVKVEPGS